MKKRRGSGLSEAKPIGSLKKIEILFSNQLTNQSIKLSTS